MNFKLDLNYPVTSFTQTEAVGQARLTAFPEVSSIGILHQVYLQHGDRGKGIGEKQHRERLVWMKEHGFQVALCTVNMTNKVQLGILAKNGWILVRIFDNCGEDVGLYFKSIV
jgi:hypothetical protein